MTDGCLDVSKRYSIIFTVQPVELIIPSCTHRDSSIRLFVCTVVQGTQIFSPGGGLDKHTDRDQRSWVFLNVQENIPLIPVCKYAKSTPWDFKSYREVAFMQTKNKCMIKIFRGEGEGAAVKNASSGVVGGWEGH